MVKIRNLSHLFLITSILIGCSIPSSKGMNGLEVVDLSSENYAIVNEDGMFVVFPKIKHFCVKDGKIVGYRIDPQGDNSNQSEPFVTNLGYFKVDIKSRIVMYDSKISEESVILTCK